MVGKKGAGSITFVVGLLLMMGSLVVITVVFFGGSGAFEETKDAVRSAQDYVPGVGNGIDGISAEEIGLVPEELASLQSLNDTISLMLASEKEECFAKYEPLPIFEDGGTTISFRADREGTFMTVMAGAGGKQVYTPLSGLIEGMKAPCVIAGDAGQARNFKKIHLDKSEIFLNQVYYSAVGALSVGYFDGYLSNDNAIDYGFGAVDLESQGWLFKASTGRDDGDLICFFPTYDGDIFGTCDTDAEGFDDDCFSDTKIAGVSPLPMC